MERRRLGGLEDDYLRVGGEGGGIMIRMAGDESSEDEVDLPFDRLEFPNDAVPEEGAAAAAVGGFQGFRQLYPRRRRLPEVPNQQLPPQPHHRQQLQQQHHRQQQRRQQQQQRLPVIDQFLEQQDWALHERIAEAAARREGGVNFDHQLGELFHHMDPPEAELIEQQPPADHAADINQQIDHLMMNNRMHPYHFRPRPIHPIAIDWMNLSYLGFPESVAISELPGSNFRQRRRDFASDLQTIRSKDITDVVCLLTDPEFSRYRVPNLLEDYRSAGLVVYHYAIEDGKIPTNLHSLAQLLNKIKKRMADGNRILIHCFGGMGRAVLIGCCLVMDLDEDIAPSEVIEQVRTLRGPRAVQSVKQYNFINEYRDLRAQALQMSYYSSDDERSVSR